MRKTINATHIEGYLYDHDLAVKVTGPTSKKPGTPFVTGSVSIATDDEIKNIVQVHFTYKTEFTSKGKTDTSYTLLKDIAEGVHPTYLKAGEDAIKLRIDSAIGLNEFYTDRNGKEELVSAKRNEGGFIHKIELLDSDPKDRNTFKADMLITGVVRLEADEDKELPERVAVKGAIFDFRKSLLPVEFIALNPNAMDYFENLGASQREPVFTQVWGRQISTTTVRKIRTESAFGEDEVREIKTPRKDFVITGAAKEIYPWDEEGSITAVELNEAIQKREIDLAAMKKRQDEYQASKNKPQASVVAPVAGGFQF